MKYGKEKEIEIFKALANKSTYKVGLDFGFDKVYPDSRGVRNAVTAIYNKIKNNQEDYGVSDDVIALVEAGMSSRKAAYHPDNIKPSLREKNELANVDIKDVVSGIRDKTFNLIDKKLDTLANSKKKLNEISFKELGVIAGIAFDKTQILKGEATENVAVLAKIDTTISADEALKLALQAREGNVERNAGRSLRNSKLVL